MTQPNGIASTIKNTFSRETSVCLDIKAEPNKIWTLLTNASLYPKWNSTIISIEGNIAQGQTINLKSTLDPKRIFKLKVSETEPNQRLTWGDAMGKRTFTLERNLTGGTTFTMREKIGGPLFPLFANMIPSFDQSFEQFAADLKKASEK